MIDDTRHQTTVNDHLYIEKATELLTLLEADHVPPWIKLLVPRLSECDRKLFVMVMQSDLALGTDSQPPGLYPSNLLCELVEAVRAFEWPKVRILVHNALNSDLNERSECDDCDDGEPMAAEFSSGMVLVSAEDHAFVRASRLIPEFHHQGQANLIVSLTSETPIIPIDHPPKSLPDNDQQA